VTRSDEESVNTDDAVRILEKVVWRLEQLSLADRAAPAGMIVARAGAEQNPHLRDFIETAREVLGLLDPTTN
jgi:hypothetical protein